MKVLAFVNKDSVPGYHRLILPFSLMEGAEVKATNDLHTAHFEGVDVFVYNRIIPDEAAEAIYIMREEMGFRIGVDIDDYWILDKLHPFQKEYEETNFARKQLYQIKNADFVTVTHERLATAVKHYNKNVYVLPNAIPQTGQFQPYTIPVSPSGKCRIFWQGSITHYADLAVMRKAIYRLEKNMRIEMVLAGYNDKELIWQKIAQIYTAFGNLPHCLIGGLHFDCYYQIYREADLCVIPLQNTTFNRMKSNLKVLEAANLSLPVIASHVHPYLDLPIRYASSDNDWYNHIMELSFEKEKRIDEGAALNEFCKKHYNFNKINEQRRQIFEYETTLI